MSKHFKPRIKQGILNWIETCIKRNDSAYSISKLDTVHNINYENELNGMTYKQLRTVLALCSACYTNGAGTNRDYWSPKYHELRMQLEPKGEYND